MEGLETKLSGAEANIYKKLEDQNKKVEENVKEKNFT